MKSIIENVQIVKSAHINIHLETKEDIEAFKEMLYLAEAKLHDNYAVNRVYNPVKKLIVSLQSELKAKGI